MTIQYESPLTLLLSQLYGEVKAKKTDYVARYMILITQLGDKKLHILLADDDQDDSELFIEAVEQIAPSVKITTVPDGVALMKKLNETNELPDLIFLDLNMPKKNGFECLAELRATSEFREIPVVIYSTTANQKQIDETYKNGANLYIQKPQHFKDLKRLLNTLLSLDTDTYIPPPVRSNFLFN